MSNKKTVVVSALALAAFAGSASAQFLPNAPLPAASNGRFDFSNLVVSQIGLNGRTAAANSAATEVLLREFNFAGVATGDEVLMRTATAGTNRRLTLSGTGTTVGHLSLNSNGQSELFVGGYDAAPGTLAVQSSDAEVNRRLAGRTSVHTLVQNTSHAFQFNQNGFLAASYTGDAIRSVTSIDGRTTVWGGGNSNGGSINTGGVRRHAFPGAALSLDTVVSGPTIVSPAGPALNNVRVVNVNRFAINAAPANAIWASSNQNTTGGNFVGLSFMNASNQAVRVIDTGAGSSPFDFQFVSSSTVYIADDRSVANGGGLQRWDRVGTVWSLTYTLGLGLDNVGLRSITVGVENDNGVNRTVIFAITGNLPNQATSLVRVTDNGAGSAFSVLATSSAQSPFRGVELIPTPGAAALLGLGGLAAFRRRR